MAVNLGTIYAELGLRMDRFVQGAQQAKVHITKLEQRMQSMQEASDMLAKGVLAVGAAMGAAGMYAITMAAQMEQSEIAFGTLLGSGEKAKIFLKDLADFAAKTPFELRGLQQSSRMLLAFGFQAQDIIPMMTAVGDAVAALGGGEFEIQRVVRALGQMAAKGKTSSEEMMQLAELGIPVWDMLAKEIGVSVPEAMELASQGAIDGMAGVNAILAGMQGRFAGAMDEQSKSILGMWSTIKDNISLGAVHLGNILIESLDISEHMQATIEALDEMRIVLEAFANVVQERGLRAAVVELFGPRTTVAVLGVAGAITGALVPAIYAATKALWIKFAALAALKPWLLAGAAAGGLLAWGMIRQSQAAQEGTKSLREHIEALRGQTHYSDFLTDTTRSATRTTITFTRAQRELKDATENTADKTKAAEAAIKDLTDAASIADRRIRDYALSALRHMDALGAVTTRQYLDRLRQIKRAHTWDIEERWRLAERMHNKNLELLDEHVDAVRDAYERRRELIEEATAGEVRLLEERLDALDEVNRLHNREKERRKHERRISDLLEQRQYHEVRLGREHQKAIADIDRQIADEKFEQEARVREESLDEQREQIQREIELTKERGEQKQRTLSREFNATIKLYEGHLRDITAKLAIWEPEYMERFADIGRRTIKALAAGQQEALPLLEAVRREIEAIIPGMQVKAQQHVVETVPLRAHTLMPGQYQKIAGQAAMPARELARLLGLPEPVWRAGQVEIGNKMFAPLALREGVAKLPIRQVAEAFGYQVQWEQTGQILIKKLDQLINAMQPGGLTVQGPISHIEHAYFEEPQDIETFSRQLRRQIALAGG